MPGQDFFSTFNPAQAVKDVSALAIQKYQLDEAANRFNQEMGLKKQQLDMAAQTHQVQIDAIKKKNQIEQATKEAVQGLMKPVPATEPGAVDLETGQIPAPSMRTPQPNAEDLARAVFGADPSATNLKELVAARTATVNQNRLAENERRRISADQDRSDYQKELIRLRQAALNKPPASKLLTPEEEAQQLRMAEGKRSKLMTPEEEAQQIRIARERSSQGTVPPLSSVPLSQVPTEPGKLNERALEGLTPEDANYVKQLVDGRQNMPTGTALKDKHIFSLVQRAGMYDPSFNAATFDVRKKGNLYFTTGKGGEQIKGLNTAVGHIDSLIAAKDALKNSDYSSINYAENLLAKYLPVNSDLVERQGTVTGVKTKFNAVKGEMASIFKQSGATDQEIKSWEDTLGDPSTATPTEWKAFIDGATELMGSRMGALRNQWETVFQKPKEFSFLSKMSKEILQKNGIDINKIDPTGKSGTGTVAAPAEGAKTQPSGRNLAPAVSYLKTSKNRNDAIANIKRLSAQGWTREELDKAATEAGY